MINVSGSSQHHCYCFPRIQLEFTCYRPISDVFVDLMDSVAEFIRSGVQIYEQIVGIKIKFTNYQMFEYISEMQ